MKNLRIVTNKMAEHDHKQNYVNPKRARFSISLNQAMY